MGCRRHVPVWHAATKTLQDNGEIRVVGIVQEQHPDRARLFMQWKEMDWPILVDSLILLEVGVVPITVAIDEHGIIRAVGPDSGSLEATFVDVEFEFEVSGSWHQIMSLTARAFCHTTAHVVCN